MLQALPSRIGLVAILGLTASTWAVGAPLLPRSAGVKLNIEGRVTGSLPSATYTGSLTSTQFTTSDLRISDSVTGGGWTGASYTGTAASMAGVRFERIADNEYLLTLSATSNGTLRADPQNPRNQAATYGRGELDVMAQFQIAPIANAPQQPATVVIEMVENGSMTSRNNAKAGMSLTLDVSVPGKYFNHTDNLSTPYFSAPGFDDYTFTGTRAVTKTATLSAMTGMPLMMHAHWWADTALDLYQPTFWPERAAGVAFDQGVQLRVTVLPEPATVLLLAAGGMIVGRRRRRH